MEVVIALIIGIIFGAIAGLTIDRINYVGTLRVDHSDPDEEEPYLFLEINKDVGDFTRRKWVTFKVNVKDYLSRE